MDTTLNSMSKKPDPSAEEVAAKELVRLAREQGLSLTGPDGLLKCKAACHSSATPAPGTPPLARSTFMRSAGDPDAAAAS